jgi:hypothetical protein
VGSLFCLINELVGVTVLAKDSPQGFLLVKTQGTMTDVPFQQILCKN